MVKSWWISLGERVREVHRAGGNASDVGMLFDSGKLFGDGLGREDKVDGAGSTALLGQMLAEYLAVASSWARVMPPRL